MSELVSIVIPAYNASQFIGRCLESLINQTYQNIEILVINDGSKDATQEISESYTQKDSRVRVINQPNGGEGSARNTGIREAKGRYMCSVDADDYVKPEFIEHMVNLQEQHSAGMVVCGYTELKDDEILSGTSGDVRILTREQALEEILLEDSFRGYVWNKMYDLNIVREKGYSFDTSLAVWTDVLFSFQYMCNVDSVVYDPTPMYYYIYVESSASHAKNHVLGVEKSYSAIRAKEQMVDLVPDSYEGVKTQLAVRYVQSSLAVIRNIGYSENNDFNKQYVKKCRQYLKQYRHIAKHRLSKKERILSSLVLSCPWLLLFAYKMASKK